MALLRNEIKPSMPKDESMKMRVSSTPSERRPFYGDRKQMDHWMLGLEKRLISFLLPMVPAWLGTVELTMMTLIWSGGVLCSGFAAQSDIRWLWFFSACIAFQHVTDMLDGAVGRARNSGLIKWGFYADHLLDYVFVCAIVGGYAFLLPAQDLWQALVALSAAGGLMAHTFLDFSLTNDYKISYGRVGVSELRWMLIAFNTVCVVMGHAFFLRVFPWAVGLMVLVWLIVVIRSQRLYRQMDRANQQIND